MYLLSPLLFHSPGVSKQLVVKPKPTCGNSCLCKVLFFSRQDHYNVIYYVSNIALPFKRFFSRYATLIKSLLYLQSFWERFARRGKMRDGNILDWNVLVDWLVRFGDVMRERDKIQAFIASFELVGLKVNFFFRIQITISSRRSLTLSLESKQK